MNGYTETFEGAYHETMNPNEPNNLNKIFKNINSAKAIKSSSFPEEGEEIAEAKKEGARIVSDGSYQ